MNNNVYRLFRINNSFAPQVAFGRNPAFDPNVYTWYNLGLVKSNDEIVVIMDDMQFYNSVQDAVEICRLYSYQVDSFLMLDDNFRPVINV